MGKNILAENRRKKCGRKVQSAQRALHVRAGKQMAVTCLLWGIPSPSIPIPATYPVAAAITQPPCSGVASTQQPWLSWLMPKLWPISWAMVAAAPMGSSEWSCQGVGGCVSSGEQRGVAPASVWGGSCVPSEEGLWERGDFVP